MMYEYGRVARVTITGFVNRLKASRDKIARSQAAIQNVEGSWYREHTLALRVYNAALEAAEAEQAAVFAELPPVESPAPATR